MSNNSCSTTEQEVERARLEVIAEAKIHIPEVVAACDRAKIDGIWGVMMHQDAFAVNFQREEFSLLALAVKYAGIVGVSIGFAGKCRETLVDTKEKKKR